MSHLYTWLTEAPKSASASASALISSLLSPWKVKILRNFHREYPCDSSAIQDVSAINGEFLLIKRACNLNIIEAVRVQRSPSISSKASMHKNPLSWRCLPATSHSRHEHFCIHLRVSCESTLRNRFSQRSMHLTLNKWFSSTLATVCEIQHEIHSPRVSSRKTPLDTASEKSRPT